MANYTGALLLHVAAGGANVTYRYDWINGELVAVPEYMRVDRIYTQEYGTDEPPCFAFERDNQDDNETQPLDVEKLNKLLRTAE